jgi:hypothetical protein
VNNKHKIKKKTTHRIIPLKTVGALQGPADVMNVCPFHVAVPSDVVTISGATLCKIFFFSICAGVHGCGDGNPSN